MLSTGLGWVSCRNTGDPPGTSTLVVCSCELAAFLKEMIIRLIIVGISLAKSKSISHASIIEQEASHTAFPLPTGNDRG